MIPSRWWVLLVFWLLLEQADAHNSLDLVLDFLYVFNGKWDNSASVQAGLTTSLVEARFVPVDIPSLRPKTWMYFENSLNGSVFSMYLCEVTLDENNSNTVLLRPYNFTDASNYTRVDDNPNQLYNIVSPHQKGVTESMLGVGPVIYLRWCRWAGEYDLEHLSIVTRADLTEFTRCTVRMQPSGNGQFSGLCPQCNHTVNEAHPACSLTIGCDHYEINRPPSAKEPTKPLRDVFQLIGARYPLVNSPKDYVSPCDKRTRASAKDTET